MTGKTLYSVATAALQDPVKAAGVTPMTVATTHPADGLWIDAADHVYVTNPETNSVEMADRPGAALKTLVKDDRLLARHLQRGAGRGHLRQRLAHPGQSLVQAASQDDTFGLV